ncbi:hypothetical protein TBC1_112134 [Lentimicrobium saccharophilum]|uniref:DUF4372 domain-containing protein n=1 Tax=Lentimicrobium saccharophilum TaxID=1678841 RepID=A0A0S7BZI9_9BACT|nr:hypothetical protein TBC1_112134 [Lentimicrobium saccharophilum]
MTVNHYSSDRYVKKFKTKDHLISILFCAFAMRRSLREASGAMLCLSDMTKHLQQDNIPRRSKLADANQLRSSEVFGYIYNQLLLKHGHFISDSRIKDVIK